MKELINKLKEEKILSIDEFKNLITNINDEDREYLHSIARTTAQEHYGKDIFIRGLIEFTNFCKNDCLYCGIRRSNKNADRYRLTKEQILSCCDNGYELGFRTFVMQGGEDAFYTDDFICDIVKTIKDKYPNCAITLSIGEKSKKSYEAYFNAGVDRYLLRHETADNEHYNKLHPKELSLHNRINCLKDLKEIGYQTGCGFMVGSPYQTIDTIIKDLLFIKQLNPEMVGIGPFIPHADTPFKDKPQGGLRLTLILLSIIRLMLPTVLLPATTALGTISNEGRELGIKAGANVLMPNLSPVKVRKKYSLYDNKICTGEEAAECKNCLTRRIDKIGYRIVLDKGDNITYIKEKEKRNV